MEVSGHGIHWLGVASTAVAVGERERYLALEGVIRLREKISDKYKTYRSTVFSAFDKDGVPSP